MYDQAILESRLAAVRGRIDVAAAGCGRDPAEITLVAVSKFHPAEAVSLAAAAGQTVFGESYIQEALVKMDALAEASLTWHFIGRLQKNKAKFAAGRFAMIHTVDSLELARVLQKRALAVGAVQDILMQVNIAGEPQKAGIAEEEAQALAGDIRGMGNLRLMGLMVMPPFFDDPERSRPYFARLRALRGELADRCGALPFLSMGMSGDLEQAVEEGATHVRVGTDIFGQRPTG
jgi:PLP dependent protein